MEERSREQELAEAQEQLHATSEVLKVISRSRFDLDPVLQTLIEHATRLCGADQGFIFRRHDEGYRLAVAYRAPAEFTKWRQRDPILPGEGSVVGRVASHGRTVQIIDSQRDRDWLEAHRHAPGTGEVRTLLGVPMLRENVPIGVIAMWRTAVRPFTEKQIELVATFADQAVIAIENVRLFNEINDALSRQTATANVLTLISRTTFEIQPVLDTVVRSAALLCEAQHALFYRIDADGLRPEAWHNVHEEYIAFRKASPIRLATDTLMGRVALTRRPVHVHDVLAEPTFTSAAAQQLGEWRTVLGVPVLRNGEPIGAIAVFRQEVHPFTEKQVELVTSFADQAAIAIGNARLFQELETRNAEVTEALEQQTATAEILRAISRSPTDAMPVFETIVRNAVALCGSLFANVFRFDGELLHYVASHNTGPGYEELLKSKYPMRPDLSQVSGRVILSGAIVRLEDARADPDYDQRFPTAIGWQRLLGVPLLREGRVLGVIAVGWAESGPVPRAQEELLKTFADQAVIAIENVRLIDEIQSKSRQLELANTYKSRFLAAASHDLRQPLHALNLFVSQLRAESDPAERSRLVERIDSAIGGMNELFNALLDMSRLDAGALALDVTEFPVERLLARMETTFTGAAREKGLRLSVVPSGAWIRSDFVLLERILLNLVSNAVRYTSRGGIVIGCRRRGDRLRLDVLDSGAGIPEEHQQSIFREFYQVAGPGPGRRGGLGLGLAIVDRLGGLLDHPVEVKSRPARGSRFSVSVPLVTERSGPAAQTPAALPAVSDPATGRLIVVIDDDTLVLDAMRGLLQSWGCRVVAEASATAALARLADPGQRPDLIISDHRLADGQTGIDAIARLREALGVSIPAFLVSGDTAPERLRDAGASGFHLLHKPVPPMALRAILNRLLMARDDAGPTPT